MLKLIVALVLAGLAGKAWLDGEHARASALAKQGLPASVLEQVRRHAAEERAGGCRQLTAWHVVCPGVEVEVK